MIVKVDLQSQCRNQNVIDPEFIIQNYGADAVRLFILSDSPPEKDVQWSEQGMVSSYKFIQKLWSLHSEIKLKIETEKKEVEDKVFEKFTNQLIVKITNNLDKFNYNVIVANMHETYNFLVSYIKKNDNIKNLENNYKKILICFSPIIPHFIEECFFDLGIKDKMAWPKFNESIIENDEINLVVQINGKKRAVLKLEKGINETEVLQILQNNIQVNKYLKNNKMKKSIFVPNRLINILIDE